MDDEADSVASLEQSWAWCLKWISSVVIDTHTKVRLNISKHNRTGQTDFISSFISFAKKEKQQIMKQAALMKVRTSQSLSVVAMGLLPFADLLVNFYYQNM